MSDADDIDDDPPLPPVKEDTLEDVVKELNSSYGDFSSGTRPYKRVNTLCSEHIFYDRKRDELYSKISITSDHQTPYGDNYDNSRHFILSRTDARLLEKAAPQSFKREAKAIVDALQVAFELEVKRQLEALKIAMECMGKGLPAPVSAPEPARFPPRKGVKPS